MRDELVDQAQELERAGQSAKAVGAWLRIRNQKALLVLADYVFAQDAWAHDYLGVVLRSVDRDTEAEQSFRAAVNLWPNLPLFHCHLGDVVIRLGRIVEGERACTDPSNREALEALSTLPAE